MVDVYLVVGVDSIVVVIMQHSWRFPPSVVLHIMQMIISLAVIPLYAK